MVLKSITHF